MAQEWFIQEDSRLRGPFVADEIRSRVQKGDITIAAEVAKDRNGPWYPITKLKGLDFPKEAKEAKSKDINQPPPRTVQAVANVAEGVSRSSAMQSEVSNPRVSIVPPPMIRQTAAPISADSRVLLQYQINAKSEVLSFILWFFLGMFGAHRFYLGKTGSAVVQLLITIFSMLTFVLFIGLITLLANCLWVLVDAFFILGWVRQHNNRLANFLTQEAKMQSSQKNQLGIAPGNSSNSMMPFQATENGPGHHRSDGLDEKVTPSRFDDTFDDVVKSVLSPVKYCKICGIKIQDDSYECEACREIRKSSSSARTSGYASANVESRSTLQRFLLLVVGAVGVGLICMMILLAMISATMREASSGTAIASDPDVSLKSLSFLQQKIEKDTENKMELYAVKGDFNKDDFRRLCKAKKAAFSSPTFLYIVVFDNPRNASFPNNPFTALYGMDENKMKHVLAVFEYNKRNGYCVMTTYSPNMWNGRPVEERF